MRNRPLRGPEQLRARQKFPGNHRLPQIYSRLAEGSREPIKDPSVRDERLARLEATLFLSDEPLTSRKIASVADLTDAREVTKLIARLRERYELDGSSFQIEELAGGFQLRTRAIYHPWLVRLRRSSNTLQLSGAALETLAIVAYRQPIVRADIENIRGVQCGEMLTQLMEKGLVKITGRQESLGRPVLYGSTKKFLQLFGLNSLKDLPEVERLRPPS